MIVASGIYRPLSGTQGVPKGALAVKVESVFPANSQTVWEKLLQPATLQFIAAPLLSFKASGNTALPESWENGTSVKLYLSAFGFIPLGEHTITIHQIDHPTQTLQTIEGGKMVPVWNHLITLQNKGADKTLYTDEIILFSGYFTRLIAIWALWFYRHRQKRWVKLLQAT